MRIIAPSYEFCDYSELAAYLTARPALDKAAELRNLHDSSLIGRWAWQDGVIMPQGPIDFTHVTPTQWGRPNAVAGAVVTLAAGYSWTRTSGTMRVLIVDTGDEGGDFAYTRSGNEITTTLAGAVVIGNALGAGHVVELQDTAVELSVGGATRAVQLGAGMTARHVAGGLFTSAGAVAARAAFAPGLVQPMQSFTVAHAAGAQVVGAADGDRWMLGKLGAAASYALLGYERNTATLRVALYRSAGSTQRSAAITPATQTGFSAICFHSEAFPATSIALAASRVENLLSTAAGGGLTAPVGPMAIEALNASLVMASLS